MSTLLDRIKTRTRPIREGWLFRLFKRGVDIIIYIFIYRPLHKSKFKDLKQYKNIHKGERVFIVATGPSLTIEDVDMLKGEYTFAMNSCYKLFDKTSWRPSYYALIDESVFLRLKDDLVRNLSNLGDVFLNDTNMNLQGNNVHPVPVWSNFTTNAKQRAFIPEFLRKKRFSYDISRYVYEGSSVVHFIMQICFYMGFSEIYLMGADCTNPSQHSTIATYKESNVLANSPEDIYDGLIKDYICASKNAAIKGVKIYNVTRGGMLEVFPRKKLEEVIKQ